jgi:hypothetical protein
MFCLKAASYKRVYELLVGQLRCFVIKVHNQKLVHANSLEPANLAAQRRQLEWLVASSEKAPRVRIKRDDRQRCAEFYGILRSLADHGLMTEVDAIEVTNSDRGIPDKIRQPRNVSEYAHRGGLGNHRKRSSQTINPSLWRKMI